MSAWVPLVRAVLWAWALACMAVHASAAGLPFPGNRTLERDVREEPVAKLLMDIFSQQGVALVMDSNVPGTYSGPLVGNPARVVETITRQFGLVWYFDGTAVFITPASETSSALLWLEPGDLDRVRHFVNVLRVADARFTYRESASDGYLLVAGPPRYVLRVREIVASVRNSPQSLGRQLQTRVFRLKYAAAADSSAGAPGQGDRREAGVASVLARVMGVQLVAEGGALGTPRAPVQGAVRQQGALGAQADARPQAAAPADAGRYPPDRARNNLIPELPSDSLVASGARPPPLPLAVPRGRDSARTAEAARPEGAVAFAGQESGNGAWTENLASGGGAVVMAEPRLNLVIVRDEPRRMKLYEDLIQELDVAPQMVEIEATIIDIDSNRLEQLGVDLKLETGNVSVLGSAAGRGDQLAFTSPPTVNGVGLVAGTVLGSAGDGLVARILALSEKGEARIVSRPKVVTMNNVEALITNTKEFNIRVAGERQADLFTVNYGLDMRVTPTVVGDKDIQEFRLLVNIQDGNSQAASVDAIPVINRSSLSTQSLVRQGDSLLVGGYVVDESSRGVNKVPGLSDIPLLGMLFKEQRESMRRTERLFLITPRLVERAASAKLARDLRPPEADWPSLSGSLRFARELSLSDADRPGLDEDLKFQLLKDPVAVEKTE